MAETQLKNALRMMVHQYGFEQVNRSLREIHHSVGQLKSGKQGKALYDNNTAKKPEKKRVKLNALEYVAKIELSSEKAQIAAELAKRFESKAFLPTFSDIRNFCQIYGINEPVSKSRASAIPRIFKFIVSMKTDEIQRILDREMFSGPSRLGPISDAIRRNGRLSRTLTSAPASATSR